MSDMSSIEARLVELFDQPEMIFTAFVIAIGVGAFHALAPGHGKAIAAAYLVGGRARIRDAALLGGVVALMHTVSVGVLALLWSLMSTGAGMAAASVTAWLQVVAAAFVVVIGVVMVRKRLGDGEDDHDHGHTHVLVGAGSLATYIPDEHGYAREYAHEHGAAHGHTHDKVEVAESVVDAHTDIPTDEKALSRRLLLALGVSGGLLPSPSAFLVLISGILTGRLLYAAALVAAFAVGMAITLTLAGVLVLKGRDAILARAEGNGIMGGLHRVIPVVGAFAVLALGITYLLIATQIALSAS